MADFDMLYETVVRMEGKVDALQREVVGLAATSERRWDETDRVRGTCDDRFTALEEKATSSKRISGLISAVVAAFVAAAGFIMEVMKRNVR